jgi:hypothetical protein
MLHRHLALTGIALGALTLACMSPNGDPGREFQSGTGTYPTHQSSGYAGARSSGDAGLGQAGSAGGAGLAGSHGTGGATGADAGTSDGGTSDGSGARPAACVVGASATFSLAWSIEDATGADSSCDGVGGKTVDIDVVNAMTGAEALTTIPCAALAATTCAMPAGKYTISFELRDAAGNVLSDVFAPILFLFDGQNTAVTSLPLQVGGDLTQGRGFAATWAIDKYGTGAIESCAQAGAASVRLTAGQTSFDLPCGDGKGRTTAVAPGTYPVIFDLLDGAKATLSETKMMNISIAAGQLVYLGDVLFDVN